MIVKNSKAKATLFVDTHKNTVLSDLLRLGSPFQRSFSVFQVFVHPGREDLTFCSIHENCNNIEEAMFFPFIPAQSFIISYGPK